MTEMAKSAASLFLLSALAAALAGCLTDQPPEPAANTYPKDYKDEILATLRKNVFAKNETTAVSNALVSEPMLQTTGNGQLYVACLRYTAHGTVYGISTNVTRIGYFYGGHLNQLIEADKADCANAAYKPFPELDKICAGTGCK
jgi:hypothetical protein